MFDSESGAFNQTHHGRSVSGCRSFMCCAETCGDEIPQDVKGMKKTQSFKAGKRLGFVESCLAEGVGAHTAL